MTPLDHPLLCLCVLLLVAAAAAVHGAARRADPTRDVCERCGSDGTQPCRDYTGNARIRCPRRSRYWLDQE